MIDNTAKKESAAKSSPSDSSKPSVETGIYHPKGADMVFEVYVVRRDSFGRVDLATNDGDYTASSIPVFDEIPINNDNRWFVSGLTIKDYEASKPVEATDEK